METFTARTSLTFPDAIHSHMIDTYSCYDHDRVAPVWKQYQKAIKEAEDLGATHYFQAYFSRFYTNALLF